MQGIRGAITVENDTKEEIIVAVQKMLKSILSENDITSEDIGAAIFSATELLFSALLMTLNLLFLLLLPANYQAGI